MQLLIDMYVSNDCVWVCTVPTVCFPSSLDICQPTQPRQQHKTNPTIK